MTFAEALARIEELRKRMDGAPSALFIRDLVDIKEILYQHADSIVQLVKVAAEMREDCQIYQLDMGGNHTYHTNSASVNEFVKAWDAVLGEAK